MRKCKAAVSPSFSAMGLEATQSKEPTLEGPSMAPGTRFEHSPQE